MTATELLAPLLEAGIQHTNYFNGRLLTAEDLRADQAADRAKRGQLGRLFGRGVAHGLMVTRVPGAAANAGMVRVEPGLALDALGQVIELPLPADIRLARTPTPPSADSGLFEVCVPPLATAVPSGVGAYILTIAGASGFQGRAPAAGLAANALPGGACGSRWAIEGVRFRLVPLPYNDIRLPVGNAAELASRSDPEGRALFRSLLASACLGVGALEAALAAQPAGAASAGGELGALASLAGADALGACEVPLALLVWRSTGLEPPDPWAVRRGIDLAEADGAHGRATGATMRRLGLAAMLHFQHLIAQQPSMLLFSARRYLAALPPVGVLPSGANWQIFLGHHGPATATPANPAMLGAALRAGLDLPATMLQPPAVSGRVENATPYEVLDGGELCGFVFRRMTAPRLRVVVANPPAGLALEAQPIDGGSPSRGSLAPDVGGVAWGVPGGRGFIIDGAAAGPHLAVALATGGAQSSSGPHMLRAGETLDVVLAAPSVAVSPPIVTVSPPATETTSPPVTFAEPERCVRVPLLLPLPVPELTLCMVPEALLETQSAKASRKRLLPSTTEVTKPRQGGPEDGMVAANPLPDRVARWLSDWARYLKKVYPEGSLGAPQLFVDPKWQPARVLAEIRETPPAWAVFGRIAIPVSISANNLRTKVPVRVKDAKILGLDDGLVEYFDERGIRTLDDLAASWGEHLRGPRPVPGWLDPAPEIIFEGVLRAAKINQDREYLAGATDEVKATLVKLGLNDDVALANADPAALGKELGNPGLAGRLVLQARRIVPESAWSIGGLGLNGGKRDALAAEGVDSQGALLRVAADEVARTRAKDALGADTQLDGLVDSAVANMTAASVTQAPAVNMNSDGALDVGLLATVTPAEATALKAAGFGTVDKLAGAEIGKIAVSFGGDARRAGAIMAGAQTAMGRR